MKRGAAILGAVALLWLFVPPSPSLAGPPTHGRLPGLDLGGVNHPCGVATDSEGDVYVSSAGESNVKIFSPSHTELASIANANEPCGVAVDSKGDVYVSEAKTGDVVRYVPTSYPFSGTPTYGSPTAIDSSSEARGISVDLFDDRLYVAKGTRIDVYEADGSFSAVSEVQNVFFFGPTGGTFRLAMPAEGASGSNEIQWVRRANNQEGSGTFTLEFNGQTTAPIPQEATATQVKAALEGLAAIGPGDVSVTGFPGVRGYWVEFTGALAETDVPLMQANGESLEDANKTILVDAYSDISGSIPLGANAGEVKSQLEGLDSIGAGNVSVEKPGSNYLVTFTGALANTNVGQLAGDGTGLENASWSGIGILTLTDGFSGHIGDGELTDATGVAAYTYVVQKGLNPQEDRYLFVADAASKQAKVFGGQGIRQLELRKTISGVDQDGNPETPDQEPSFGAAGASVGVDPGNGDSATQKCKNPIAGQACTAGHFFVYDAIHKAVDEFEATGRYFDQFTDPAFVDAEPTAIAVDRSSGANDGTIYVTSGVAVGAEVLAFGPVTAPLRPPRPKSSFKKLENARDIAVDRYGDRYVTADKFIYVYAPEPALDSNGNPVPLATIEDPNPKGGPSQIAVDSAGHVYAIDGDTATTGGGGAVYWTPDSFPVGEGTQYSGPTVVATAASFPKPNQPLKGIGVNPANNRVFVTNVDEILELGSAQEGSPILKKPFGSGIGLSGEPHDVAVYGISGDVYVGTGSGTGRVWILNPAGTEVLARITGADSPSGPFGSNSGAIAVDQSNGHVLVFNNNRGVAEEFEPSGAFVAQFGSFTKELVKPYGIAIDNSGGPSGGNVFVAFDDTAQNTFDVTAFGPLSYGGPPEAVTTAATGVGSGSATLNGTVNPVGFDLTDCHFEYLADATYEQNIEEELPPFIGAVSKECVEGLEEIGAGSGAIPVHADVSGLDPEARYRFRLVAANKYGTDEGEAGFFGPPKVTIESAHPISYTEATLRASIDPFGLATQYRFEYGTSEEYGQSTPTTSISAEAGPTEVEVHIFGLAEGTAYHFRLVVENEAGIDEGPDQVLETLKRRSVETCPNKEFRTGRSAGLPDCRAYELVTPPDTRGYTPYAPTPADAAAGFNNWPVEPRGEGAGESIAYAVNGTLPGFDGNGQVDVYRAARGEGGHPETGWANLLLAPTYGQAGGSAAAAQGMAPDQEYSFWGVSPREIFGGTLSAGTYLRTPTGFEPLGEGNVGTDPKATGRFLSAQGVHVIFSSKAHLEENAPPVGTEAIYDRAAASSDAHVVSLLSGDVTPLEHEDASYVGSTEDGSVVAFKIGGALYVRRNDAETVEVAAAPNAFAGISEDGSRVFFANVADGSAVGTLFACDVQVGPCAGVEPHAPIAIATESVFVNVSADGSAVYFTSKAKLDGAEEGVSGQNNLYLWDGSGIRFVALLDPKDFVSFGEEVISIGSWSKVVVAGAGIGRAFSPTRSTPEGAVLVFQSHADLTGYENEGFGEIYRYDREAGPGKQITCVSCDPSGAQASATAQLQSFFVTDKRTLIPNLSDDGREVFFEGDDSLLPEDANTVRDVYEWMAPGTGCERPGGCLALISSGQGEDPSYLYGMTPDGHDVFFATTESLAGVDIAGSSSIYDARVDGGIPEPLTPEPCHGDACQGEGSIPPVLPGPASTGSGGGDVEAAKPCRKGSHRVKGRCLTKHRRHRRHHRRATHRRGAGK